MQYAYAKWVYVRFRQNDPMRFLVELGVDPDQAMQGFASWRPSLELALSSLQDRDGCQGGISLEDGMVLYGLVRALRPQYVVETGVAAGLSTSFLGAALIENGRGELFSIELPPSGGPAVALADGSRYSWQERGVGWAIPNQIRLGLGDRHQLVLRDVRLALPDLLQTIPQVDLFFHDDLHTPDHMIWEYETVWPRLSPGGVLVSDDVNYGWIEFCRKLGRDTTAFHNVNRLCALRNPDESGALPGRNSTSTASTLEPSDVVPAGSRIFREDNRT